MKYIAALLALTLFIYPVTSHANKRGAAFLAAQHKEFPVEQAAKLLSYSPDPIFSVLWVTFGRSFENIDYLIQSNAKTPVVQIYLTCEPCRRPRRDGSLKHFRPDLTVNQLNDLLNRGDRQLLEDYAEWIAPVLNYMQRNPGVTFQLVPALEDSFSSRGYKRLVTIIKREVNARGLKMPQVVRSPLNPYVGTIPREIHDYGQRAASKLKGRGNAACGDGVLGDPTPQLLRYYRRRNIAFLMWRDYWQGLDGGVSRPVDQRWYQILPSDIRTFRKLVRVK